MVSTEDLLDILGSKTRREILRLLADRPRFVSEIAETMGIGRKAIIEHLESLEKAGLVRSICRRIEKGRPRKYYEINREIFMKIVLTRDSLVIKKVNLTDIPKEAEKLEEELDEIEISPSDERRVAASYIVERLEKKLEEIEREWAAFQKVFERAKRLVRL